MPPPVNTFNYTIKVQFLDSFYCTKQLDSECWLNVLVIQSVRAKTITNILKYIIRLNTRHNIKIIETVNFYIITNIAAIDVFVKHTTTNGLASNVPYLHCNADIICAQ